MAVHPAVGRLIALVILGVLALAVWAAGVAPMMDAYARRTESAAQSAELIARYRSVLAGLPRLEAEVAALRAHPALKRGLIAVQSAELAAARLQGKVKASVAKGGARLISIQVLAAAEEAGFGRIGVRAQLSGTVAALTRVLLDLQTAWPVVIVDSLGVRAEIRRRPARRGETASLTVAPALSIRLDAFGFMALAEHVRPGNAGEARR